MAFIFDTLPTSADIIPDAHGNAGHTRFADEDIPPSFKLHWNTSPQKKCYFEMRVLRVLAGTAAHDLMCPGRKWDCGDLCDEQQAKDLIEESMSWEHDPAAALCRLKKKARENLECNWPKVEAVASLLLAQGEISASEIKTLLGS